MAFEVQWKRGYRPRVSAQVAQREVKTIEDREGRVSPEAVVEAAQADDAPLHPVFTWNDAKAAHQHRLAEARRMLNHLVVVEVVGDDRKEVGPAYVSIEVIQTEEEELARGYVSLARAQSHPEMQHQVVAQAIRGLRGWRKRYESLRSVFPDVFRAIEEDLPE